MDKLSIALKFLKEINNLGYEAYLIGGATRDYLLGRSINDIDITTNMPIEAINESYLVASKDANKFLGTRIIYDGLELEITHFRKELSYKNHRHPVVVLADSLNSDLIRRDFTINAIAMDYQKKIYDNYYGLNDLKNHLIKTIGRPERRFNEDALRMLRAIYFSLKLDFKIEAMTMRALRAKLNLLGELQTITVLNELLKIFRLKNDRVFKLFKIINLKKALPYLNSLLYYLELNNYYPCDLFELIYLISYYNGSLLEVNIKKEWKRKIIRALKAKKEGLSFNEILSLVEKGEEDV